MGFGDLLKAAGRMGVNALQSNVDRVHKYKERYESLDDKELFRKFKNAHDVREQLACKQLLEERGYGRQDN